MTKTVIRDKEVEKVLLKLDECLDEFLLLDDFQKDDVFANMTVPKVKKIIVLSRYLDDFKKRVNWDGDKS